MRSRSRQLTATGHARRLLLSAGPVLLTIIVIGHGTKLVAPFLLDLVSSHVPRRAQLARRAAHREISGGLHGGDLPVTKEWSIGTLTSR